MEKELGKVTIDLKIKKTMYLKFLQIKIVGLFSKKKAADMLNNLNGNKYVKVKTVC